jgi:hypothetical protein
MHVLDNRRNVIVRKFRVLLGKTWGHGAESDCCVDPYF